MKIKIEIESQPYVDDLLITCPNEREKMERFETILKKLLEKSEFIKTINLIQPSIIEPCQCKKEQFEWGKQPETDKYIQSIKLAHNFLNEICKEKKSKNVKK